MPLQEDMFPITYLARNPELQHLWKHPLIKSFLLLKWRRLNFPIYSNMILQSFYLISCICYTAFVFGANDTPDWLRVVVIISMVALLLLQVLVETLIIKEYISKSETMNIWQRVIRFVIDRSTTSELAIFFVWSMVYVLVGLVLWDYDFGNRNIRRFFAALLILVLAYMLTRSIGSLPFQEISIHMIMLRKVSKSLVWGLINFSEMGSYKFGDKF